MINKKIIKPELTETDCNVILEVIFNSKNLHGSRLEALVNTTKTIQEILRIVKEEKYKK